MFMKCFGGVNATWGVRTRNNQLHFGTDPDPGLIFFTFSKL